MQYISQELNNCLINVATMKAPNSLNSFTSFTSLNQTPSITKKILLSINELKEVFISLKTNKHPGYDDTNFNAVKKYFEFNESLKHLLNFLLELKIFLVISIFV